MPAPTLRERRSARTRPANTLRETMAKYSSFLRNCSSNRSCLRGAASAITSHLLGCAVEDLEDHAVGVDPFGLALEVENEPMAQGGRRQLANVLAGDRITTLDQRAHLGSEQDRLRAPGRAAIAHVALGDRGC